MELSKTKSWFYLISGVIILFIMVLGCWWLFLVFKLASQLENASLPSVSGNLITMVQWEGFTFFTLVLILGIAVLYFFVQDHKKTKSLHAFFASLTHELKTPLASIKLQADVLNEFAQEMKIEEKDKERIIKYTTRLTQDSSRLEGELENHLQLSRLERKGKFSLTPIDLTRFLKQQTIQYTDIELIITELDSCIVLADEFALKTIIRNLIQNSYRHNKDLARIKISIVQEETSIKVIYTDFGQKFSGEINQLGKLFYKHDSPKGSGIGLYLIKSLSQGMGADFSIRNEDHLNFEIRLKRGLSHE